MSNPSSCEFLYFNDRWFRVVGVVFFGLIIPPIFFRDSYADDEGYWHSVLISMLYTAVTWELARQIFMRVNRRFPDLSDNKERVLWILGLLILLPLVICPTLNLLLVQFMAHSHQMKDPTWVQKFGSTYILMLTVGAMYEGARYFFLLQKAVLEKEQVERDHLASQLDSLRNQVNPHFLFNSLNTLTWLIPEEPEKAVRFVQQLSRVYRYILEHRDEKITALHDELDFLKSYNFLLKERFGDNLRIEIHEIRQEQQAGIVPLTLQMLFENAIKHNVISKEKPLLIEVFSEAGHLVVRNTLQRKNQVMHSTGVGLENIRQRYKILTGCDIEVVEANGFFTVKLPCPWCESGTEHVHHTAEK